MMSSQSFVRVFVPVFLVICFLWILLKYSSIQASIETSTNELLKLDKVLDRESVRISSSSNDQQQHQQSQQSQSVNWVQELLQDAELVWQESKNKRVAAMEELEPYFKDNPWHYFAYTMFWDFFTPTYHCPRPVERVGRVGDGGKWVCGFSHIAKKKPCIVYSYGISDEITFEEEILERSNCEIRMFDYTINVTHGKAADLVKKYSTRAKLYKIGLGEKDSDDQLLRTLKTEMELQGDTFIDILKMDIEGGEFNVMRSLLKEFPSRLPFGQLQIELHLVNLRGDVLNYFSKWFDHLEDAGLRAFFSEPNQIPNLITNKSHIDYIEYSFLNSKMDPNYFYQ